MEKEQTQTVETQSLGRQLLLAVAFDHDNNNYIADIPAGVTVEEAIFSMSVVLRCLEKDGIIESTKKAEELLHRYLTDPQYEPLQVDGNEKQSEGDAK